MLKVLEMYEQASGQQINKSKTSMSFNGNVAPTLKGRIKAFWGVSGNTGNVLYLGLPQMVGRAKTLAFAEIKQQVWKKLQGWKEKLLSQGGKEILIKVMEMSIPTYIMCCFKPLISLCNELGKMMTHFWWGQRKEE